MGIAMRARDYLKGSKGIHPLENNSEINKKDLRHGENRLVFSCGRGSRYKYPTGKAKLSFYCFLIGPKHFTPGKLKFHLSLFSASRLKGAKCNSALFNPYP